MKVETCGGWVKRHRAPTDIADQWYRVEKIQIYEGQRNIWVVALGGNDGRWETAYFDTEVLAQQFAKTLMAEKMGEEKIMDTSDTVKKEMWLVWSLEHAAWWKPASLGYTSDIKEAGRYFFEEAVLICQNGNFTSVDELMVPVSALPRGVE
jgi:hypothetical protein